MNYLLSGSNTFIETIKTCYKITNILHAHGFHLKMWNLRGFRIESQAYTTTEINCEKVLRQNATFKVLGVIFTLTPPLTKRQI